MASLHHPGGATAAAAATAQSSSSYYSPAVCRSSELLSCARTVIKIAQSQQQQQFMNISPSDLHLYPLDVNATPPASASSDLLEDGLSLLRTMEAELKQLEALVRRRGHSNDPTEEISASTRRLEADTRDLTTLLKSMELTSVGWGLQPRHHWKILQEWFTTVAKAQGERLQKILKIRAQVLAEQAQRRKQFQVSNKTSKSTAPKSSPQRAAPAQLAGSNPLFQIPPSPGIPKPPPAVHIPAAPPPHPNNNGMSNGSTSAATAAPASTQPYSAHARIKGHHHHHHSSTLHAPPNSAPTALSQQQRANNPMRPTTTGYSYYSQHGAGPGFASSSFGTSSGGGGGGYGGGGYGGGMTNTGMRQRRTGGGGSTGMQQQQQDEQQAYQQEQERLLIRQQERQTQHRLREAQQAETALANLGTLFGKMSTLISQQAEVIDNIEDDVEAAHDDVKAGQEEITTLYSIKKGNRALILKVFGLIIFLIIFLRFYG